MKGYDEEGHYDDNEVGADDMARHYNIYMPAGIIGWGGFVASLRHKYYSSLLVTLRRTLDYFSLAQGFIRQFHSVLISGARATHRVAYHK